MKKILFTTCLSLLFSFQMQAKKMEGRIITENDTTEVLFSIPVDLLSREPNYQKLQNKVKYFDSKDKKKTIRPDDIIEYQFIYNDFDIRMVSVKNDLNVGNIFSNQKNIFLKLEYDGKAKLFRYYSTNTHTGGKDIVTGQPNQFTTKNETFVIKKEDTSLLLVPFMRFKKKMSEFFSDCPKLIEKINKKEFQSIDILQIVLFYNTICQQNK